MLSSVIGKVDKAMRYATEPERIVFRAFHVAIQGDHRSHVVRFDEGRWHCDCETFDQTGYCSHTMTMERVLRNMLPVPVEEAAGEAG